MCIYIYDESYGKKMWGRQNCSETGNTLRKVTHDAKD